MVILQVDSSEKVNNWKFITAVKSRPVNDDYGKRIEVHAKVKNYLSANER